MPVREERARGTASLRGANEQRRRCGSGESESDLQFAAQGRFGSDECKHCFIVARKFRYHSTSVKPRQSHGRLRHAAAPLLGCVKSAARRLQTHQEAHALEVLS